MDAVIGDERSRQRGPWCWAVGITASAVAVIILFLFDPVRHGFYPRCAVHVLTGLDCPGCGGLRALHEMLHGHVAAAFELNPLVPLLPAALLGVMAVRAMRPRLPAWLRAHWPSWLIAALILFGIARNLPRLFASIPNP